MLGKLQALPKDGLPITDPDWNNLDRAFYNVTEGIRTVVEQLEEMRLAEQVRLAAQERQAEEQKARLAEEAKRRQAEEAERLRRAEEEQLRLAEERQRKVHVATQSVPTPQPFRESHSPVKPLPSVKPEALSLLPTLTVHTSDVTSVAFRPDGQTVASGSTDQTIKLWDVASGQEVRTLTGHTDVVTSVAFSPDGQTVASGSWDGTIKIWGNE